MPARSGRQKGKCGLLRPPQTGKAPVVIMPIQLGAFDERTAWLDDPANVAGLSEQFTSRLYSGVA
jgi:hypothetical protein